MADKAAKEQETDEKVVAILQGTFRWMINNGKRSGGHCRWDLLSQRWKNAPKKAQNKAEKFLRKCGWLDFRNHTGDEHCRIIQKATAAVERFQAGTADEQIKTLNEVL